MSAVTSTNAVERMKVLWDGNGNDSFFLNVFLFRLGQQKNACIGIPEIFIVELAGKIGV